MACPLIYFRSTICFISDEPDWNTVFGTKVQSIWNENTVSNEKKWNGILFPKLFWPTVRKNCSSDREKFLKFVAEGQKFEIKMR